jgi:hypothetical protein
VENSADSSAAATAAQPATPRRPMVLLSPSCHQAAGVDG